MKKIFTLVLVLTMIVALAACGGQEPEVVENVNPNANNVVVETPPAIVSGTDNNPVDTYPAASALPTTVPTAVPTTEPFPVTTPAPTATAEPTTGNNNTNTNTNTNNNTNTTGRNTQDYHATVSKSELENGTDGYVTGEGVNFRVGPGSQYKIIECLDKGTKVLVLGKTNSGWTKIWYNDYVGYIYSSYISDKDPGGNSGVVVPDDSTPAPTATAVPSATVAPTQTPVPSAVVVG